jgi:hypothetical protein
MPTNHTKITKGAGPKVMGGEGGEESADSGRWAVDGEASGKSRARGMVSHGTSNGNDRLKAQLGAKKKAGLEACLGGGMMLVLRGLLDFLFLRKTSGIVAKGLPG